MYHAAYQTKKGDKMKSISVVFTLLLISCGIMPKVESGFYEEFRKCPAENICGWGESEDKNMSKSFFNIFKSKGSFS